MEKIKRVLLKLSGEALAADAGRGLDFPAAASPCPPRRGRGVA